MLASSKYKRFANVEGILMKDLNYKVGRKF